MKDSTEKETGADRTRANKKGRRVGQRRRPGERERRTTLQVMVITNIVRFLYQSSDSQPDCSAASMRRVNRLLIRHAVSPGWHRERGQECVGWRQLTRSRPAVPVTWVRQQTQGP